MLSRGLLRSRLRLSVIETADGGEGFEVGAGEVRGGIA